MTVTAIAVYAPQVSRRSESSTRLVDATTCRRARAREICEAQTLIAARYRHDLAVAEALRADGVDGSGQHGHRRPDRRLRRGAVAEQQRSLVARLNGMLAEAAQADASRPRLVEHPRLVELRRQDGQDVKPCGDPAHLDLRQPLREGLDENVAAAAGAEPAPPQGGVGGPPPPRGAGGLAALEEITERELLEPRRRDHRVQHLLGDRRNEPRRRDQPAESKRRRQRLPRRAEIGDAVGREALKRADWRAVVAELSVVVVLCDDRVAPRGPLE